MNINKNLITYISGKTRIPESEITETTDIFNPGFISSMILLELMSYVENEYNITIKPEELIEENFKNIKILTDFIIKKKDA